MHATDALWICKNCGTTNGERRHICDTSKVDHWKLHAAMTLLNGIWEHYGKHGDISATHLQEMESLLGKTGTKTVQK